jgi:hypothetical protein
MMENYGFVLITSEEAKQLGLPNSTGLFSELFAAMDNEVKQNPKRKAEYKDAIFMSAAEKGLSFINRYFVFKKTTSVKAAEIEKQFLKKSSWEVNEDEELIALDSQMETERKSRPAFTGKIRKLKATIVLQKYVSPIEKKEEDEAEEFLDIEKETEDVINSSTDSDSDKEEISEDKKEELQETELPFIAEDEEPIVLKPKPKVVLSDKKIVIKKK